MCFHAALLRSATSAFWPIEKESALCRCVPPFFPPRSLLPKATPLRLLKNDCVLTAREHSCQWHGSPLFRFRLAFSPRPWIPHDRRRVDHFHRACPLPSAVPPDVCLGIYSNHPWRCFSPHLPPPSAFEHSQIDLLNVVRTLRRSPNCHSKRRSFSDTAPFM
jgi:hypothetical protein